MRLATTTPFSGICRCFYQDIAEEVMMLAISSLMLALNYLGPLLVNINAKLKKPIEKSQGVKLGDQKHSHCKATKRLTQCMDRGGGYPRSLDAETQLYNNCRTNNFIFLLT